MELKILKFYLRNAKHFRSHPFVQIHNSFNRSASHRKNASMNNTNTIFTPITFDVEHNEI